jgi:hypothetical protein
VEKHDTGGIVCRSPFQSMLSASAQASSRLDSSAVREQELVNRDDD